mmetsp:Transcript_67866/g.107633  ORF Transcript_67866/g.107633 Transcript_67866/m.107633 type:complete len:708 (+) Transcript_67866:47-2170(+)|eukprot:CAMPEP_0169146314 /NCGR_PEP_ID=MMETSP1015-20121227/47477_1 /TAXON_ID=342587 /ORGANISM="Karlodinium micrum, Strain CCMP2283" /LENGTH=707 /DNA_ID=CAMNT_0009214159 /DNA_START=41 /DNA_END=2164 /DNA_ORIENTATION=+
MASVDGLRVQKWQALEAVINAQAREDEDPELQEDRLDKYCMECYEKGGDLYQKGDYDGAIAAYSDILAVRRDDIHAYWQRGAAREQKGDREGAIADYSASLQIDSGPQQAGVFFSRASARSEIGDEEGAIADWSEVVRLDPKWVDAWCCRGTAKFGMGDAQGAIADADAAILVERDSASAWGLRAAAKQMLEDYVGAVADSLKALELDRSLRWVRDVLEGSRVAAPEATVGVTASKAPELIVEEEPEKTEPMPSTDRLRELIKGIYERKNPEKLAELDRLFEKYAGKEMTMYRFICNKYGVKPIRFIEVSSDESQQLMESPQPDPGTSSSPPETSENAEVANADAPEIVEEDFEPGALLSRREQGNLLFKKGKLRKAVAAYKESVDAGEEDWILALSNRAICHLKLKEYEEALSAANACLEYEPASDIPWKVHLTKFKALSELRRWVQAFSILRKLRARADLPTEVLTAATQEERTRRRQYAEWAAEEWSSSDEEEDDEPENATFYGEPAEVSRSLARAVQLVVPKDLVVKTVSLVQVFGETSECFREALASSSLLAPDCVVSIVKREAVCNEVDPLPELVVLCRPRLSSSLELWLPILQFLVEKQILTVVTGFTDQSMVQNEDILEALGCSVVSSTACCFDNEDIKNRWMTIDGAGGDGNGDCHPHHHALAFQGGRVECVDLESLRTLFSDRGFDVDLSQESDEKA